MDSVLDPAKSKKYRSFSYTLLKPHKYSNIRESNSSGRSTISKGFGRSCMLIAAFKESLTTINSDMIESTTMRVSSAAMLFWSKSARPITKSDMVEFITVRDSSAVRQLRFKDARLSMILDLLESEIEEIFRPGNLVRKKNVVHR
jgi:hypothetical protein